MGPGLPLKCARKRWRAGDSGRSSEDDMTFRAAVAAIAVLALSTFAVTAQDATAPAVDAPAGTLAFQLNKAETIEGNCNLTFVVPNNPGPVIEKSNFDLAIVDTNG